MLDDQQMISKGALMSVILKNASKSGNDEMIARALLPLTALLDQRKHNYWLKFHPPIGLHPSLPFCNPKNRVQITKIRQI